MAARFLYKFSDKEFGTGEGMAFKKPRSGFLWVHVVQPTADEIKKLRKEFELTDKEFDRPLERYHKERRSIRYTFKPLAFVLVDYYVAEGQIGVENVLFVIGENFLLSITNKPLKHYDEIYKSIAEKLKAYPQNVGYLLYDILDADVETNFDVLRVAEDRISNIEKGILEPAKFAVKVTEIIDYKRYLLKMWRRFWGSSKVLFSIKKGLTPIKMDENLTRLIDDVHDTYVYQMEIVNTQRGMLTDALTINQAVISNQLAALSNNVNINIRRLTWITLLLTGFATVLTVPNTIATIYGVPYFVEFTGRGASLWTILVISTIVPTLWFAIYWRKVRREATEAKTALAEQLGALPSMQAPAASTQTHTQTSSAAGAAAATGHAVAPAVVATSVVATPKKINKG